MTELPDTNRWDDIVGQPNWYVSLWPELKAWRDQVEELKKTSPDDALMLKDSVQGYFEAKLDRHQVALASKGENMDAERRSINKIIIHHTGRNAGVTPGRLNAIQLLNLYVPHFVDSSRRNKFEPLWSNHVRHDVPVFWAYHWLVRGNGETVRLLRDNEIGWQAGDWSVNCSSVAICIDDDLSGKIPSNAAIEAMNILIKSEYAALTHSEILGHNEVNPNALCPGKTFANWKAEITSRF